MLRIVKQCQSEINDLPIEVRGRLADAIARLERGHQLSMPLSRPMPDIGKGVYELRFRHRSGIYRVIYFMAGSGEIWLIHAFIKKTEKTPHESINTSRKRLGRIK